MILLRHLTLARAGRPLLEAASLTLHAGWKVGVTGANGCGKSSLFALLTGALQPEAGELELPPNWTIAHVGQETPPLPQAAIEYVLDGDAELRRIEAALRAAEAHHDGEAIAHLHAEYGHIGGYGARARAAALLAGLGFGDGEFERPVAQFSGGWRMRLNLARALMCRSDLLLLDEPTNHLDLDAVIWLEGWLQDYRGTLLLVSHDRDFLDAIVGHILHIEGRRARLYTGNYSAFERARAEALAREQAMYARQQREIARLARFIDRFRAKATKARQAQSRLKALARMERISAAHVDTPFAFRFPAPAASPDPLLTLEEAAAGYDGITVLRGLTLSLRPGERLGLLGKNGAGKTTLLRLLAGETAPLAGSRREARGLRIGYFAQHQLERLRADESPLQHLRRVDPQAREQELRDYLGGYDFRGEMATRPVGLLSGGEKSRLALALLVRQRPNLLLLDEPTNHLDLEMRHALTLALSEYEGAVVLVSHDRHLLRTVCDGFCLVADGRLTPFDGDLDDYRQWLERRREGKEVAKVSADATAPAAAPRPAARRPSQRLLREIERLEARMAELEAERRSLDARLADPALYQPAQKAILAACQQRRAQLADALAETEAAWLAAQEELENSSKPCTRNAATP